MSRFVISRNDMGDDNERILYDVAYSFIHEEKRAAYIVRGAGCNMFGTENNDIIVLGPSYSTYPITFIAGLLTAEFDWYIPVYDWDNSRIISVDTETKTCVVGNTEYGWRD
jgi:hypothetical protein